MTRNYSQYVDTKIIQKCPYCQEKHEQLVFHQFKCEKIYKNKLNNVVDPNNHLQWESYDEMMLSITECQKRWSILEEGDHSNIVKQANINVLRLFGKKVELLARICEAKVNGFVD